MKTEQSERFLRAAAGIEARPPHAENTFLSLSLMSVDIACNVALRRGPERDPKLGTTLSNPVYKLYKTERLIPPSWKLTSILARWVWACCTRRRIQGPTGTSQGSSKPQTRPRVVFVADSFLFLGASVAGSEYRV